MSYIINNNNNNVKTHCLPAGITESSNHMIMPKYSNNTEYRQSLRQFFQMNSQNYPETMQQIPDLDDETRDEMSYDEAAAAKTMDYILSVTANNKLFQDVYDLAAAQMFSTDREIGLAVLLSYDYLYTFYGVFNDYAQNKSTFSASTPTYMAILQKFVKKCKN